MSSKNNTPRVFAGHSPALPGAARTPIFLCAILCLQLLHTRALAVPACPEPAPCRQPDGTTFRARKVGDERRHVIETEDGYTVIKDNASGVWFYARESDKGNLERTPFPVGKVSPGREGIRKHLRPARPGPREMSAPPGLQSISSGLSLPAGDTSQATTAGAPEPTGTPDTIKNLVILARFSDHTPIFTQSDFDALFNEIGYSTGGAYGSVRDYYREASYGRVEINSTVTNWVTLPYEEAYYGANDAYGNDLRRQQMAEDAIDALNDTGFDFAPFDGDGDGYVDMLTIIHSGLGEEYSGNPEECIWSHMRTLWPQVVVDGVAISQYCTASEQRYRGPSIVRIGVICHEMGHLLGLPDLYDTDFSSSGIGTWGIMAAGSWGGDMFSAERPVHFCAWSKIKLGWLTPTEIDGSDSPVTVPQIEETTSPIVYRISAEMADAECLLIENRQKRSYDARLPGAGLLIWHIDDNKSNNDNENHYMVALLQADGEKDLEAGSNRGNAGDSFPGSTDNRILTPDSDPSSDSYINGDSYVSIKDISDSADEMTFRLSSLVDIHREAFSAGLPADWTVVDGYSDGYTWTDGNPAGRANSNWSGTFMIADSAWAGLRWMDEELISPAFDCSDYTLTHIQFTHYFNARRDQTGDVDLRVNGGAWTNIARYVSTNDQGLRSIDISSYADGEPSVQIRWHFYDAHWDRYWGVDNFALRGMPPANDPPEVSITSVLQRTDGAGHIEIVFKGTDPDNDSVTWVNSDCQFAPSPYTEWQSLAFDTADPAHTAGEPMLFTSAGASFVAVVDASTWDGAYKVKLRVSDGTNQSLIEPSDEFTVDNTPGTVSDATHLVDSTPQSGDTTVAATSSWEEANPGTTWFSLKVNGSSWTEAVPGSPTGSASQSATFTSVPLEGDDYLTARSHHTDAFGNESSESISSPYYVTPMVPSAPGVNTPTPNSLRVTVIPNAAETGDVDYAISCTTTKKYVDYATGTFVDSAVWGKRSQWGGNDGVRVTGLSSKTTYSFRVMAANPLDRSARSDYGDTASATTANMPPNPPQTVVISPESPISTDDLVCSVIPAVPPDADSGDTVTYQYTWSCPGKADIVHGPNAELTDTLSASHTQKGDTWACTVQAYDASDYSQPVASAAVLIGNSAPYPPKAIALSPIPPDTADDLICTITPANPLDPDPADTVTYRYTWSCPEKSSVVHGPKSGTSDNLSSALTEKGDVWTCQVEAYDDEKWSSSLSRSTTIANTAPNPPSQVVLSPEAPISTDDITCSVTPAAIPDADTKDSIQYQYTWANGIETVVVGPTDSLSATLPSSDTDKGDVWSCTVVATDGEAMSEEVSGSVVVGNSPPSLEVTGSTVAYEFMPVDLSITADDADNDPISLSCEGAPDGAAFTDHGDGTATFHWVPATAGTYALTVIANDVEDQTPEPISITVAPTKFRIAYIGLEPTLSEERVLAITWFAIPGAVYSVYRSQDLVTFERVASNLVLPEGSIQGDWLSYREELDDSALFFYRVSME